MRFTDLQRTKGSINGAAAPGVLRAPAARSAAPCCRSAAGPQAAGHEAPSQADAHTHTAHAADQIAISSTPPAAPVLPVPRRAAVALIAGAAACVPLTAAVAAAGAAAKPPPDVGEVGGTLNNCRLQSASCASSMSDDDEHFVAPWEYEGPRAEAVEKLIQVATGGYYDPGFSRDGVNGTVGISRSDAAAFILGTTLSTLAGRPPPERPQPRMKAEFVAFDGRLMDRHTTEDGSEYVWMTFGLPKDYGDDDSSSSSSDEDEEERGGEKDGKVGKKEVGREEEDDSSSSSSSDSSGDEAEAEGASEAGAEGTAGGGAAANSTAAASSAAAPAAVSAGEEEGGEKLVSASAGEEEGGEKLVSASAGEEEGGEKLVSASAENVAGGVEGELAVSDQSSQGGQSAGGDPQGVAATRAAAMGEAGAAGLEGAAGGMDDVMGASSGTSGVPGGVTGSEAGDVGDSSSAAAGRDSSSSGRGGTEVNRLEGGGGGQVGGGDEVRVAQKSSGKGKSEGKKSKSEGKSSGGSGKKELDLSAFIDAEFLFPPDDNIVNIRAASRAEPALARGRLALSFDRGLVIERNQARQKLEALRKALRWEIVPVISDADPKFNNEKPMFFERLYEPFMQPGKRQQP